jgi:hypothetical protein
MTANSSIVLTQLDFNNMKESLKAYLKSQSQFKDYDFSGSSLNVLLDLLSYNTYNNTFYLNQLGSEMFLDTSQLRDSVVSHAKELNYLPRSFISSEAVVGLELTSSENQSTLLIPKGSIFTGRNGADSFVFTTEKNILANRVGNTYIVEDLSIFEGNYVTESFIIDNTIDAQRFTIANKNIDTRSLTVSVIEDDGSTIIEYQKATSLFGLNEITPVFFIQAGQNETYEIIFGDGVIGRKPKDNSVVLIEYRVSNGELPNGINNFKMESLPDTADSVTVTVVSSASGGLISEDILSIKFNAPRAFTTQERAVTAEDYENLLKINFPEVNVVSAYGGEEADPPQYGKVVLSVDIKGFDGLPRAKEQVYKKFLKELAPLSIDPVFVQPEFIYLNIESLVRYNINLTGLSQSDIRALVVSSILEYKESDLDDFKTTGRYSRIISAIDDSHLSVVSNETTIKALKYIKPKFNKNFVYNISFYQEIEKPAIPALETISDIRKMSVYSSPFITDNKTCYLVDDGLGIIRLVTSDNNVFVKLRDVGAIDYTTGNFQVTSLNISRLVDTSVLKIYARTLLKDIRSDKNVILTINEDDIVVNVEQIRE